VSNFSPARLDALLREPGRRVRASPNPSPSPSPNLSLNPNPNATPTANPNPNQVRPTVNQLPYCVGYHDETVIAARPNP
jgi:hypothetical protein